jgi:hypothetical protein
MRPKGWCETLAYMCPGETLRQKPRSVAMYTVDFPDGIVNK